jgi:pimeloyl-ACP methyl ester carboxylesterase
MSEIREIHLPWEKLCKPVKYFYAEQTNTVYIDREVIPIIFIPGIMGSNLQQTSTQHKAWCPDNIWHMLTKHIMAKNLYKRRQLLVGDYHQSHYLSVDPSVSFAMRKVNPRAQQQSWGGIVFSQAYAGVMAALQHWQPESYLEQCFEFPVHGFAYNWTTSNAISAQYLQQHIHNIIRSYQQQKRRCRKVILVTHSMGGLVARYACKTGLEKYVAGVVHVAQPINGTPTTYWRMKSGFERVQTDLHHQQQHKLNLLTIHALGPSGKYTTTLLAGMPGALQLLPNQHYRTNQGNARWLSYQALHTPSRTYLPGNPSQSHEEIYLQSEQFFRLIEPEWIELIQQAAHDSRRASYLYDTVEKSVWKDYLDNLSCAQQFHQQLGNYHHANTYQIFAQGLSTADCIEYSAKKNNTEQWAYYLHLPNGEGDGTVPLSTASAAPKDNHIFVINAQHVNHYSALEHQDMINAKPCIKLVHKALHNIALKTLKRAINEINSA